jgi:hypothetical protein
MATSEEILDHSNNLIAWMASHCTTALAALDTAYAYEGDDGTARLKANDALITAASKAGTGNVLAGWVGSYIELFSAFNPTISSIELEKIVTLLKGTNRIYQTGSGKGKAIFLLQSKPIGAAEYIEKSISSNDALGLSKALKDAVASIVQENKNYKIKVKELEESLKARDIRIAQLNAEVSVKYKTTWT